MEFLKRHFRLVGIIGLWILLVIANYLPGTWLIGWDNLLPELNPGLNLTRALYPAWQEYQGLGLLGGIGHGSELTRQLMLLVLAIVLPSEVIRYSWTFLMLLIGPIGVYFLVGFLTKPKLKHSAYLPSLVASIFYLCNIATVQAFFVPLESFSSFYGFFPWLLWSALQYLESGKIKKLWVFFGISVLTTSAFHVQTMFVVYGFFLSLFLLETIIRFKVTGLKRVLSLLGTILVANAFWLLPVLYFTITSAQVTVNSKQNLISTPESHYYNQEYGSLRNIALLKGYWFNYLDFDQGKYVYLLDVWKPHFESRLVTVLGYTLFVAVVIGLVLALLNRPKPWAWSAAVSLILVMIMLTAGHGKLGQGFTFLAHHLPLFNQIFRVTFTKWSLVAGLVYSLGLGMLIAWLSNQGKIKTYLAYGLSIVVITSSLWIVKPMFTAHLFYDQVKIELPPAYEHLFAFFQTQPKQTRIVYLPAHSMWGWNFYTWHYRGSGFLWYGIEQPILDRNFDVWSDRNETFYNQLSHAIYSQDPEQFTHILQQYDVSYALIDESVIAPNQPTTLFKFRDLKTWLAENGAQLVWSEDFLSVYDLRNLTGNHDFIYAPDSFTQTSLSPKRTRVDVAFRQNQNYIAGSSLLDANKQVIYPLGDLYQEKTPGLQFDQQHLRFDRQLPNLPQPYNLVVPPPASGSGYTLPVSISLTNQQVNLVFGSPAEITVGDQQLSLPTLEPLTLPLATTTQKIFLQINHQTFEIDQGAASTSVDLSLTVNQPLTYSYFRQEDLVEKNGEFEISDRLISTATISGQIWNPLLKPQQLALPSSQLLKIKLNTSPWSFDPTSFEGFANCDVFNRGSITKTNVFDGAKYQARNNGGVCEGIDLTQVLPDQSYLMRWRGENQAGRSLKYYLLNPATGQVDLEDLLPEGPIDQTYSLLAQSQLRNANYYLNWETRSFGEDLSQNQLTSIDFYPLPLEQLAQLALMPQEGDVRIHNQVDVSQVAKWGTHYYQAQVTSHQPQGVVVLSQSFDQGWLGFKAPSNVWQVTHYKVLPHLTFNGWANAWMVPEGETKIMLLYWPQLLGFAGYGLLGITVIYFAVTWRRSHSVKNAG
jgi:hypothetical protein